MVLMLEDGQVDLESGQFVRGRRRGALTTKECQLLEYLAKHPGQALSRDHLHEAVWGYNKGVVSRTLDTTISTLRTKIEALPSKPVHIVTAHGMGYMFSPPGQPLVENRTPSAPGKIAAHTAGSGPFVGRHHELNYLNTWFQEHPSLLQIVGCPGVGKTRLVAEFCHQLPEQWLLWIDPQEITNAGLGPRIKSALDSHTSNLAPGLAVLDCPNTSDEILRSVVDELRHTTPNIKILVLTHLRRRNLEERSMSLQGLDESSSLRLLLRDQGELESMEGTDDRQKGTLAELAKLVDALPLGLVHIETLLRLRVAREVLDGLLFNVDAALPQSHWQSVLGMINNLSDVSRRVFLGAANFVQAFAASDIKQVLGHGGPGEHALEHALQDLVWQGLLEVNEDTAARGQSFTVSLPAHRWLVGAPEGPLTRYQRQYVAQSVGRWSGFAFSHQFEHMEDDLQSLRQAKDTLHHSFQLAVRCDERELAMTLIEILLPLYAPPMDARPLQACLHHFEQAFGHHPDENGRLLLAGVALMDPRSEECEQLLVRAEAVITPDTVAWAVLCVRRSLRAAMFKQKAEAFQWLAKGLSIGEHFGHGALVAWCYLVMARLFALAGDGERAIVHFALSAQQCALMGGQVRQALCQVAQASMMAKLGQFEAAADLWQKSSEPLAKGGRTFDLLSAKINLAWTLCLLNRMPEVELLLKEAEPKALASENSTILCHFWLAKAYLAQHEGSAASSRLAFVSARRWGVFKKDEGFLSLLGLMTSLAEMQFAAFQAARAYLTNLKSSFGENRPGAYWPTAAQIARADKMLKRLEARDLQNKALPHRGQIRQGPVQEVFQSPELQEGPAHRSMAQALIDQSFCTVQRHLAAWEESTST